MGKKKWIDKKNARTFTLVHRPQNDPLIHDDSASSMVFKSIGPGNQKPSSSSSSYPPSSSTDPPSRIKSTHDLATELGPEITSKIRSNEGQAAQFGILYDDTLYDYMQHLRDLGVSTEAVFVDASQDTSKQRGNNKQMKLEDVLREAPGPENFLPKDLLPNEKLTKRSYQDQQNIPDELAGFQPDMDPRLREVLEALEDEEYVDDDEDIFSEILTGDREEVDLDEFIEQSEELDIYGTHGYIQEEDEDEGWATDDTEKPSKHQQSTPSAAPPPTHDWLSEFSKFKCTQKSSPNPPTPDSEIASSIGDLSTVYSLGGSKSRRRRKKAAAESVYSMSSSVLSRTEGQTLLDERFDKIEALYEDSDENSDNGEDPDDAISTTSKTSSRPSPPEGFKESRQDFNAIMDDFLENYSVGGKYGQRVKRGKQQTGLEQLDEIRRGLGKARIGRRMA
ncbi:Low temperature viability protein [Terfezia boudieri ATCC MYA-4762]|uniref:Low temperature viability protein n=1 Tax=Terfezia boudieri ATCC MYA-4762 TaxID=1051890 RepID=A0A3N4LVI6_9PEZI|nr:Low temperature viability protein [Terfezia boudieri ATCC MYA-4762]